MCYHIRQEEKIMDVTQVVTVMLVMATNLGTVIALYLHNDKKIEEGRKETNEILKGIREDIKEFHLAMRDFHGRLCSIEERGKK